MHKKLVQSNYKLKACASNLKIKLVINKQLVIYKPKLQEKKICQKLV